MEWLTDLLKANEELENPKKVILSMHIFPGEHYFREISPLWHTKYTTRLLEILDKYHKHVKLATGAHIHRAELRLPKSSHFSKIATPLLITESLTPIFFNNPSFTTLNIQTQGHSLNFKSLTTHAFQLQYYILFGHKSWVKLDWNDTYGIDINK